MKMKRLFARFLSGILALTFFLPQMVAIAQNEDPNRQPILVITNPSLQFPAEATVGREEGATVRNLPATSAEEVKDSLLSVVTLPFGYAVTLQNAVSGTEDPTTLWYLVSFVWQETAMEGYLPVEWVVPAVEAEPVPGSVSVESTPLYRAPSLASETVKEGENPLSIPAGHSLLILRENVPDSEESEALWCYVSLEWGGVSYEGYLPAQAVTKTTEPAPDLGKGTVLLLPTPLYLTPSASSETVSHEGTPLLLPDGYELVLLEKDVSDGAGGATLWYRVSLTWEGAGYEGYLPADAVLPEGAENPWIPGTVGVFATYVYSSASRESTVLSKADRKIVLPKDHPITVWSTPVSDEQGLSALWVRVVLEWEGELFVGYLPQESVLPEGAAPLPDPEPLYGSVNQSHTSVYLGTGSDSGSLLHENSPILLPLDLPVTVIYSFIPSADPEHPTWHQVRFRYYSVEYVGFIPVDFVQIQESSDEPVIPEIPEVPDEPEISFEEQLASFPESYRPYLLELHEKYPNWKFQVFYTNLDWNTVLANQNKLGRSLTDSTYLSYYSTAEGSYDWYTDRYFALEAGRWYQAASEVISYYMDPRNFLNENDLFMFEQLSFNSAYQTEEAVEEMLKGTFMEGKSTLAPDGSSISYAKVFLIAAYLSDVSPFHLVTRCIQEVGWKGTHAAHGTHPQYQGYYNFFSIGANTGMESGLAYAKNQGWDSPYKAILAGAKFIGGGYIEYDQDTPYFQKFSVVKPGYYYWHQYMTNVAAAYSEGHIQKNKYQDMDYLQTAFTFRIPVYLNMPEENCSLPKPAGSPNNLLKELSVQNFSLTPTFDLYEGNTDFTLIINGKLSAIKITAAAVSSTATLSGHLGEQPLKEGENRFRIVCTSASGVSKEYTITVVYTETDEVLPEPGPDDPVTPDPIPPAPEVPGVTPGPDDRLGTVCATEVQVRIGPGTNHGRLSHNSSTILLNPDHPLILHGDAKPGEDGNPIPWYSVTFVYRDTQYSGYIRSDLITVYVPPEPTPEPEEGALDAPEGSFLFAIPSLSGETLSVGEEPLLLPHGTLLSVLERGVADESDPDRTWVKVKLLWEGQTLEGYLPSELVKNPEDVVIPTPDPEEGGLNAFDGSPLYVVPSLSGDRVLLGEEPLLLPHGTLLSVLERGVADESDPDRTWVKVRVLWEGETLEGYLPSELVTDPDQIPPKPIPSGWDHPYTLSGVYLTGLTLEMDAADFLASLGAYGLATVSLKDGAGTPVSSGAVRTGWILSYFDGETTTEYVLVLYGDVNGDSAVNSIDLLIQRKYLLDLYSLSAQTLLAADVNHDGTVNSVDLLLTRKYLLGLTPIEQ